MRLNPIHRPGAIRCLAWTAILAIGSAKTFADDPCVGFKWDVRREHALFGAAAAQLAAGKDLPSAPSVSTDRLYALALAPQSTVTFAAAPGKRHDSDGAYAGIASFEIDAAGYYRVSVSAPVWIDVASNGTLAPVRDFQGLHGCDAPHKIVEFDLARGRRFVLQLSAAESSVIRVTVTKAPPRT